MLLTVSTKKRRCSMLASAACRQPNRLRVALPPGAAPRHHALCLPLSCRCRCRRALTCAASLACARWSQTAAAGQRAACQRRHLARAAQCQTGPPGWLSCPGWGQPQKWWLCGLRRVGGWGGWPEFVIQWDAGGLPALLPAGAQRTQRELSKGGDAHRPSLRLPPTPDRCELDPTCRQQSRRMRRRRAAVLLLLRRVQRRRLRIRGARLLLQTLGLSPLLLSKGVAAVAHGSLARQVGLAGG